MSLLNITNYRGTFARDILPKQINDGEADIINMDLADNAGTHWVCIYNGPDYCEYFDSYGLAIPNEILKYMRTSGKKVIGSTNEIQNINSIFCGYYCLYYLLARIVSGLSPYEIVYKFENNNSTKNDKLLLKLLQMVISERLNQIS